MTTARRPTRFGAMLLLALAFCASDAIRRGPLSAYVLNYRWGVTQVPFYINPANADMSQSDAETVIKAAAADWSMQSNANIAFYYLGRTGDTSVTMNGKNTVFFRPDASGMFGQTYRWYQDGVLLEADVVLYDGSTVFLPDYRACSGTQHYLHDTAIHELGHALGLGHSAVAEATMWPSVAACSTSLRTLAADDKAGIEALYKPTGSSTGTAPAAPSGSTAAAASSSSINLRWTDNASNETGFAIERTAGGTYAEIARVSTNVVSYVNSSLSSGTTYSYRVRAYNSAGYSAYSNAASAATPTASTATSPTSFTLSATARKVKGVRYADLSWRGVTATQVDVYRNGTRVVSTANDGSYTDAVGGKGSGTFSYKVCATGTSTCSNVAAVTF